MTDFETELLAALARIAHELKRSADRLDDIFDILDCTTYVRHGSGDPNEWAFKVSVDQ